MDKGGIDVSPVFEYQARNRQGEKVNGTLEVENSNTVARQLKEQGYFVTSINEKHQRKDLGEYFKLSQRVKTSDLAIFSQQFSAMINAGISLVDSLNIMQDQTENTKLKEVLVAVQEDVETGLGLSETMMKYPNVFPDLYCQMVKAGETGGILDRVLIQLAEHYEKQEEINGKLKSALYYPITILCMAVVVVIFLIAKVVPQFVSMFDNLGGQLPLPTRILMGTSDFMQNYWWAIIIGLVVIFLVLYSYKKTPKGEYLFDKLLLKLPMIGKMMKKVLISRFASTLSILLTSGVDLLSALTVVEDVLGNKVYGRLMTEARGQVREGINFSKPLAEAKEFPPMVVQMVRVGEETGTLDEMLLKITSFYDREVETSVEGTISMIEPVMIVFLAIIVGFIVISIVMPMFDMFQYF